MIIIILSENTEQNLIASFESTKLAPSNDNFGKITT